MRNARALYNNRPSAKKKHIDALRLAPDAGAPSGPPSNAPRTSRRFNPKDVDTLSDEEVKSLLPPDCTIKRDAKENRWRMRSPLTGDKSKSYGRGSQLPCAEALRVLVQLAWHKHTGATDKACPFDLNTLDGLI